MSAPATESQWFYVVDDNQVGPLAKDQLIRAVEKGIVQPDTLVWRDGLKDWVEASRLKFLSFVSDNPFAVTGRDSDEEEQEEEEDPRPKKKKKKKRIEYGTFWNRVVGFVVDNVVLLLIFWVICFFIGVWFGVAGIQVDPNSSQLSLALNFVLLLTYWLYFACLESSSAQATVGKMAAGIKVVNENGDRIGFLHATGRCFARLLTLIFFGIGFIVMLFTEKKQGVHDLMAGTFVVKS